MSSRAAQLAVELTEQGATEVAGGMDTVTSSAKRMGDTVDSAGKQAKSAGDRMDSAAGGADELASKGAQAAGAMGGLGELIGGPFGAAMQTGGIALQAAADSGDLLNAALENSVVASARAKAGTIAKTVADKASAAATRVMAVAQRALNLAQRASPIGLIITAVLLLAGALVLAYKRSSTFRAIVQGAMNAAKAAVDRVKSAFSGLGPLVSKIMKVIGAVVGVYVRVYSAYFRAGLAVARLAWTGIQAVVSRVVGVITNVVGRIRDATQSAFSWIKDHGADAFDALIAPVQRILDLVQSLIDKIKSIHLPHVDLNPFGDRGLPGLSRTSDPSGGGTVNLTLNVAPAPGTTSADAQQAAQGYMDAIDARLRTVGRKPVFSR